MILSHLSGIRHYEKDAQKVKEEMEKAKRLLKLPVAGDEIGSREVKDKNATEQNSNDKQSTSPRRKDDYAHKEFYLKDKYESVTQGLDLFKDDPLIFRPGKSQIKC